MHCSKCGGEQLSGSVRFCSRCGARLETVEGVSARRLMTMPMFLVLTVFAIFGSGSITGGPGYIMVRVLVTIIAAITFYLLYSSDLTGIFNGLFAKDTEQQKQIAPPGLEPALPPAHSTPPVSAFVPRRVNTAEMVQPPRSGLRAFRISAGSETHKEFRMLNTCSDKSPSL